MSKKKKNKAGTSMPVNIVLPNSMSADEMKHIIADGLMEFEERKKWQEREEKIQRNKEWQRVIGLKDFSNVKKPLRWWLQFWNAVKVFKNICFISEKHVKGDAVTFGIMQTVLELFFGLLSAILLLFSVALIWVVPILYLFSNVLSVSGEAVAIGSLYGMSAFIFSIMFRVARLEIMNMEDRNYLFGIFTCVASIVSAVAAVVTIFMTQR